MLNVFISEEFQHTQEIVITMAFTLLSDLINIVFVTMTMTVSGKE